MECAIADNFEVFVADDAFEGSAIGERSRTDVFEFIGESDALEGGAVLECPPSKIRNVAMFTEYHTHEMGTVRERKR